MMEIVFTDERTYAHVDTFWDYRANEMFEDSQVEINQQLFAQLMGWA
jgi:hypothetical protein